ncbi:hypothetical protein ATE47_12435 [Chryseobacterium sp. IHB B 17019]|uniref:hypothetical protein n=1 Tax=Chryseobacterium sp. IHB B 17019 TaxID=1721091 RepID=UPI00071EB6B3|nr:hypothetical protein [Chryseobacterium sp. IHB B 17019]ALR31280.1 hypothetical protein ATE47_12435 [Chryseobacterium sp. IHB B 17019]
MKEIIIKSDNSQVIIDKNLSSYLLSYFFILLIENKNKIINDNIKITEITKIKGLHDKLSNYLDNILIAWYEEPSQRELQKYSSRYEKIRLNDKDYKINYRMSEIGRLVYVIFCLLQILNDTYHKNSILSIEINKE